MGRRVALGNERGLRGGSWRSGGGFWVLRKARKRLEGKFGFGADFGQELVQVFVVERFACGGGEGWRLGGFGRWYLGE